MADEGGSETENPKSLASMDDLKQVESSMMSKFEEMMTILQSLKPNPMVALDTPQSTELPPTVTVTAPGLTPAAVTRAWDLVLLLKPLLRFQVRTPRSPRTQLTNRKMEQRTTRRCLHRLSTLRIHPFPFHTSFPEEHHPC